MKMMMAPLWLHCDEIAADRKLLVIAAVRIDARDLPAPSQLP